jgi:hypothetical protein
VSEEKTMDILSIQPSLRTLVVKHPATGEPVGLEIDFRSMDSPEAQAVERQLKTKALRSGRSAQSVDKLEEGEYALLHAVTAAWRWSNGMALGTDTNPPLTRQNTEKLYRSASWIKKQLDDEMRDESGFFSKSLNLSGS